jgi:hypothetical protein
MLKVLVKNILIGVSFLLIVAAIFILSIVIFFIFSGANDNWVLYLSIFVFLGGSIILSLDYIQIIRSYKNPKDSKLKVFIEKSNLRAVAFKTILYSVVIILLIFFDSYAEKQKVIKASEQKVYEKKQKEKERKNKEKYSYLNDRYYKCYGEMTKAHKARGFHQSNRETSIKVKETVCKAYGEGQNLDYEGKR